MGWPSSETEVTSDAGGLGKSLVDMRFGILPMAGGSAKFRVQPRKPYNVKIFISHLNRCGRKRRLDRPETSRAFRSRSDRASKARGREAFEVLYNLHKRRVYSLCLRMVANTAEAEDLAQEAFLQLFRKIGTFRGESAFSTWLHRISVNVVLMHLRKKGLPVVSLDDTTEGDEDTQKSDYGADDLQLSGSIDRLQLQRAVDRLPPGYRTVFVLHDVEGFEHNEIAGMVGCSIGNSKSQLHKARMKLRDILKSNRAEKAKRA